jgi:hypothetical protein
MRQLFWAVAAALGAASNVTAGPIGWSYSAEYIPTSNPELTFTWANQSGSFVVQNGDTTGTHLFNTTGFGGPPAAPSGNGLDTIRYDFDVKITLTDHNSGQSGSVTYQGYYSSAWEYHSEPGQNGNHWEWIWEVSGFGDGPLGKQSLVLGGNRYTSWAEGGGTGQFPDGYLNVTATHETPEPATLVMAGIGLAGFAGLRVRRRLA